LTEEKDAIFVLVPYGTSHINFLRDWTILKVLIDSTLR
jgi:hypothetical protein